jgi:hypothetical protein
LSWSGAGEDDDEALFFRSPEKLTEKKEKFLPSSDRKHDESGIYFNVFWSAI